MFVICEYPGIHVYRAGAEGCQEAEWDKEDRAHKGLKHNLAPKFLTGDKKYSSPYYSTYDLQYTVTNPNGLGEARAD